MNVIRYNTIRRIDYLHSDSLFSSTIQQTNANHPRELTYYDSSVAPDCLCPKNLQESKYNIMKTFGDNKTVIINTLYDSIVMLNEEETSVFYQHCWLPNHPDFINQLYMLGILIDENEDESSFLELQKNELIINKNGIPTIMILPTQDCNARCAYCFEEHNPKTTMTEQTINDVIYFFAANFSEGDRVLIRWFGGEPLLAHDVINQITYGLEEQFNGNLLFESSIITNGSLLTDEIIHTAKTKWRLKKIQLSLDGYSEEHNRRKNYYDSDVDYYQKTFSDIDKLLQAKITTICRINLDRNNINNLDNILHDLSRFKDNALFYPRVTVLRPTECGFNEFNFITPSHYEWAYDYIYNKLYDYGFLSSAKDLIPHRLREVCLAKSLNKLIIGADGKIYKCLQQQFDDAHSVGDLKSGIIQSNYLNYCKLDINEQCTECVYLPTCLGGCQVYRELGKTKDITPCKREKFFTDMLLDMIHQWG